MLALHEQLLSQTSDMAEFNQLAMQYIHERTELIKELTVNGDDEALTHLHRECQADILRWQEILKRLRETMANIEKIKQYCE